MGFQSKALTLGLEILTEVSAKSFTTVKTGGPARYFSCPDSAKKLSELISLATEFSVPYKVVGNGSNLLVSDKGFNGLIVSLRNIKGIREERGKVRVACGESVSAFVKFCISNGFCGTEGLFGIPATVGGAICQNASAFGFAISDHIEKAESYLNGKLVVRDKDDCRFNYRDSVFKRNKEVILSATFSLPKGSQAAELSEYTLLRNNSQPKGNTFGSVFKNPKGGSAGKLIEDAELKGFKTGGAEVSRLHANFIVNNGNASSLDVFRLICLIKKKVFDEFNVVLQEEVEFVGEF